MNLPTLAFRNIFRHRARAFLTLGGVAVLTLAFIFLRTLITSFTDGVTEARSDRLVVRSRLSLTVPLPQADFDKIKAVPGVSAVTWSNWFGGTYIDARNFFPRFAVDPATYFEVYKDISVPADVLQAFRDDRTGGLIGEGLVSKYGFKVGDVIHIDGDIYPGPWAFTVRGTFKTDNNFVNSGMYIHWKYIDQAQPEIGRGYVGNFAVLVDNPDHSPQVARAIDALFADSAHETITESEQAFVLGFITGSQAIIDAIEAVSFVLLFIMLLILGNTLAMAVRERTNEIAVLRTLGFQPGQLVTLSLAEGFWLGLLGGSLGALIARPVLAAFIKQAGNFVRSTDANRWTPTAILISVAVGLLAAAIPAVQASRVDIIAALRRIE